MDEKQVKKEKSVKRHAVVRLIIGLILLALTGLSMLLFSNFPEFFFPAYRAVSKAFIGALSWIFSVAPFGLWDFLGVLIITGLLVYLIVMIVGLFRKKKVFFRWLSWMVLIAGIVLFVLVDGWMLNHFGPGLRAEMGIEVRKYTEDELFDATAHYFDRAAEYAFTVPRDENGDMIRQDFYELAEIAGKSYHELGEKYWIFTGTEVPVKPLLVFGDLLMYSGIAGEFMPLTGEASLPLMGEVTSQPFTMCHEAAHRLSIASEEEANFAAFLASTSSTDERFVYSGYYEAFIYCYNALFGKNYERLKSLVKERLENDPDGRYAAVIHDTRTQAVFYDQYESKLQEVSEKANDHYLKTFKEESGVKSYGEVVDDLIIWFLEGNDAQ